MKYTIQDFTADFATDADCLQYLFDQRFPNGGTCEKCGKSKCFYPVKKRKCYACSWCGFQVSPTADTIFHKSPTSLRTWFHAMFLITASRNGVSAMELMRQTGVTYKTAWRINHQIRQLMQEDATPLSGVVEADETYIGGKPRHKGNNKRGRGAKNKTIVAGIVERGGGVRAVTVPNCKGKTLIPNIQAKVVAGTTVYTDEFNAYNGLKKAGFVHDRVMHKEQEYVRGDVHTNTIDSFWAQLKRSINGTFHHVSPQHLPKYLTEFSYRHNHRKSETPLFSRLIATAGEQRDSAI
jgi:transposase-like protein